MTALYWQDFDCTSETRAIEHESTIHQHYTSERQACEAFVRFIAISVNEWLADRRYYCIRGPGGLIRGVNR